MLLAYALADITSFNKDLIKYGYSNIETLDQNGEPRIPCLSR